MTSDIAISRRRTISQVLMTLAFEGAITPVTRKEGTKTIASLHSGTSGANYEWAVIESMSYGILRPTPLCIVTREHGGVVEELESVAVLFDDLRPMLGATASQMKSFVDELQSTIKNDVAVRIARRERDVGANSDFATVENAVTEGHRYHPCFKSRMGFSVEEHARFASEFAQPIVLVWVAIHRSSALVSVCEDIDYEDLVRSELSESTIERFSSVLRSAIGEPSEYVWLPVHPWQFERVVEPAYIAGRDDKVVIALGEGETRYTAQQSLRTLQNIDDLHGSAIKLALSVTTTSMIRILKPHDAANGPKIADWLHSLLNADTALQKLRPIFLREVAGVSHLPESRLAGGDGTLACLWRESPYKFLDEGESAVPLTALVHVQPDGKPFIDPWIERYGLMPWVEQTLRVIVEPPLHVFACHGIALEAHSQNLGLVHRDGSATRLFLKDFHDSLEYSPPNLARPDLKPQLMPMDCDCGLDHGGSDTTESTQDLFHAAMFLWSMVPFGWFLEDFYGLSETDFLELVARITDEYLERNAELIRPGFDPFKSTVSLAPLALERFLPLAQIKPNVVDNPLVAHRKRH